MARTNELIIICLCGSDTYYYLYLENINEYQSRCFRCNAIVQPFESGRIEFIVRNERAGYFGTD